MTISFIRLIKYRGDMKSGLVWISMVKKRLVCKWSGFQTGSEIQKYNHLNLDKWPPFCHIWTKMSRFWMVGTIAIAKARPFEIRSWKSPDFKFFRILNGQISDPHCTVWNVCSWKGGWKSCGRECLKKAKIIPGMDSSGVHSCNRCIDEGYSAGTHLRSNINLAFIKKKLSFGYHTVI